MLPTSVIATLFGVCTSLGLGTMQINRGLHLLQVFDRQQYFDTSSQIFLIAGKNHIWYQLKNFNSQPAIPVSTSSQLVIIWAVTAVATGSVLTGVGYGIRRISEICFSAGMFLMLIVLLLDNTVYLLNLYVQSMGFYVQNLLQMSFHSDAFEQLGPSHGAQEQS